MQTKQRRVLTGARRQIEVHAKIAPRPAAVRHINTNFDAAMVVHEACPGFKWSFSF
jgi:hypothetical protein